MDEPRIYSRALSSGEINQLYRSNLNKYDTGQWLFTSLQTGLTTQTYVYTGTALDLYGNSISTERRLNVDQDTSILIFT
jgi:hypothetical protein